MDRSDIEKVYPLTTTQAGMLFESLAAKGSVPYLQQAVCALRVPLDEAAFHEAVSNVSARHEALRSCFAWKGLNRSAQIVVHHVRPPLAFRNLPADGGTMQQHLDEFMAQDLVDGLDLNRPPCWRITVCTAQDTRQWLVWTFHHALIDGWSLTHLVRDLMQNYTALVTGRPQPELPRPPPFSDFLRWLHSRDKEEDKTYWQETLEGFEAPTPLPFGASWPSGKTNGERDSVSISVNPTVASRCQRAIAEANATLAAYLSAAWALVIARHTDSRDIVFGLTLSGRSAPVAGIEDMVGMLINTLPLRIRVPEQVSAEAWLREIMALRARQIAHEHVSLSDVTRWCLTPGARTLFQTGLVIENFPIDSLAEVGGTDNPLGICEIRERTELPVLLVAVPNKPIRLNLIYAREAISEAQARRLLDHVVEAMEGLAFSDRPVGMISILPPAERVRVNWELAGTDSARVATARDVLLRILDCARQTPEDLALIDGDGNACSFQHLADASAAVACRLSEHGLGFGSRIGVPSDISIPVVAAVLGIWRIGAAFVTIDTDDPPLRQAAMLDIACVDLLLADGENRPAGCPVMHLETGSLSCARDDGVRNLLPRQPAYVLFTSGSTGLPKGVEVSRQALARYVTWASKRYLPEGGRGRTALCHTRLSFDLTFTSLFVPLSVGACVRLGGRGSSMASLLDLADWPETAALLKLTPTHLRALAKIRSHSTTDTGHRIVVGGEALFEHDLTDIARSDTVIDNEYGPTEATVGCCVGSGAAREGERVPIGRPAPGTCIHLVDSLLRPVPLGAVGEICIGGAQLANGYVNAPGETARRFCPDPFATEIGARLFRTGDLGRWVEGNLVYLGRTGSMLKVRGHRVEPGEIIAALSRLPEIRECAVIPFQDPTGETALAAFVVTAKDANLTSRNVITQLGQRLPAYLKPGRIIFLNALPQTRNGKIDHSALSALLDRQKTPSSDQTEDGELEAKIAQIWADALGLDEAPRDVSFFELGGHSLLLLSIYDELRGLTSMDLSLADLIRFSTIEQLTQHLLAKRVLPVDSNGPSGSRPHRLTKRRKLRSTRGANRE